MKQNPQNVIEHRYLKLGIVRQKYFGGGGSECTGSTKWLLTILIFVRHIFYQWLIYGLNGFKTFDAMQKIRMHYDLFETAFTIIKKVVRVAQQNSTLTKFTVLTDVRMDAATAIRIHSICTTSLLLNTGWIRTMNECMRCSVAVAPAMILKCPGFKRLFERIKIRVSLVNALICHWT